MNGESIDEGKVLARLRHRGPDGTGSSALGPRPPALGEEEGPTPGAVHLLHARLSIIDLSAAGAQPMRDPRTGNVITFNGEIYNFRRLRDELTEPDEPWLSHSDTEVILRAWRRWGLDCLTRLRGMFAFALWDAASRKLILARDRFGIKPLYVARRGRTVGFASEIRAILAMGIVDGRVDPARVAEFLRWQSAVGQGTIVEGVEMVGAGGVVAVSEDGEVVGVGGGRWTADGEMGAGSGETGEEKPGSGSGPGAGTGETGGRAPRAEGRGPNAEDRGAVIARVRTEFDEAVRVHLESDVPVGAFLSGGLDSSAIVGTLAHLGVRPKTFTVCWDGGDDESVAARRAAELAGAEHHEVRLTQAEVLRMIPEALERMDSPTADGVNSYVVSWAVRQQGLKVALSGLGGDELFGGYPSFARVASGWARMLGMVPRGLRSVGGGLRLVDRGFSTRMGKLADLMSGEGTLTDVFLEGRALFSVGQVGRLVPRPSALGPRPSANGGPWGSDVLVRDRLASREAVVKGGGASLPAWTTHPARERLLELERELEPGTFVSYAEMMTYMHDTLLRDTDQMSMAHGLEVRVPFLDSEFASRILELPDRMKFGPRPSDLGVGPSALGPRQVVTKPLLVEAFADRIPSELHGLPKRGFSLPMRKWMRGPLREFCLERIESEALERAGIDRGAAREVWRAFGRDQARWSRPWALVVLAEWVRRNV